MDQLILYEFEMLEPGSSSARAEAWRSMNDHSNPTKDSAVEQAQRQVAKLTRTNDNLRVEVNAKQIEVDKLSCRLKDCNQVPLPPFLFVLCFPAEH